MELEQLLKGKVSGLTNTIVEDDKKKGIKQYVFLEEKGIDEMETGNKPNHTNKKCKSIILLDKDVVGKELIFLVEVFKIKAEKQAPQTYYKILSLVKA